MSKYKIDFDLKKKVVFKLLSEVLNLFEPKDIQIMIKRNMTFYEVVKSNMPELIEYLKSNGKVNSITKDYIEKLIEPNAKEEFVYKYLPKFVKLFETVPTANDWFESQIQYILNNIL